MSIAQPSSQPLTSPAPVTTAPEAERLAAHLIEVMDLLVAVVQQETELVRAGRLAAAARLETSKGDLTRLYIADTLRLRASQAYLAQVVPDVLATVRQSHETFRALLQINLTVLATAHAVSEGIVRGVSGEMALKATPQTYGSSGRTNAPSRSAAQPLAVSRML